MLGSQAHSTADSNMEDTSLLIPGMSSMQVSLFADAHQLAYPWTTQVGEAGLLSLGRGRKYIC